MAKLSYSLFTENDAEAVAELFRNNQFWMAKYDPNLNGDTFVINQLKKGFVFGIVGRDGDHVASYLGCYQVGGQRVCAPGELLTGIILIDKKYRSAIFSIAELFNMLLEKAIELGYQVLLMEISATNQQSLSLNRRTGALLLDPKPTVHGEVVLTNFMPMLVHHVCTDDILESDIMPSLFGHVNKKDLLKPVEYDADGCFEMAHKANGVTYRFTVDPRTRHIIRSVIDDWVDIRQDLRDRRRLTYTALCEKAVAMKAAFVMRNGTQSVVEYDCPVGMSLSFIAPPECDHILVDSPDNFCVYRYDVNVSLPQDIAPRQFNSFAYHEDTGYLDCGADAGLFELWPCFTYPYLEGALAPNKTKSLAYRHIRNGRFSVRTEIDQVWIERAYDFEDNGKVVISTKAMNPACKALDPLFHFAFGDTQRACTVYLQDGSYEYRERDNSDYMFPELPYHDYQNKPYSQKYIDRIVVQTDDGSYTITCSQPTRCFFHRNYMRLMIEPYGDNRMLDFGIIKISKD